jgi:hypothetical protein
MRRLKMQLGIRSTDFEKYNIPKKCLLSKDDIKTGKALLKVYFPKWHAHFGNYRSIFFFFYTGLPLSQGNYTTVNSKPNYYTRESVVKFILH